MMNSLGKRLKIISIFIVQAGLLFDFCYFLCNVNLTNPGILEKGVFGGIAETGNLYKK